MIADCNPGGYYKKRGGGYVSSGSYKQVDVQCPFYRWDDGKQRITCEGIINKSSIILSYRAKSDYLIQMDTFCCRHYDRCEVYQMLMQIKSDD